MQLYAAGFAGNGSAPQALLAAPLLTDASGGFDIAAGAYSCPATGSVLYVIVSGGTVSGAGTTSATANGATTLMTVPGVCSGIASGTKYIVNELTTAASAYALRPFLAPGAQLVPQLGSAVSNTGGLALGAATVASLVNLTTGEAPGPGFPLSTGTLPMARLNSVANALHGCAVSTDGGACTALFNATAGSGAQPASTFEAALSLANNPGNGVSTVYQLSKAAPAFSPALNVAPADWTLPIAFTGGGMNQPSAVSLDSSGNVWVVSYYGVASLFSNTGVPVFPQGITGYGLNASYGGAVDATDRLWVANTSSDASVNGGNGSITVLNSQGAALPGNSQFSAGGLENPIAVAFDGSNDAWVMDYYASTVVVLNSAGGALSGGSGYVSGQLIFGNNIALDTQGNAWVGDFGNNTLTEIVHDGSAFTSYLVGNEPDGVAVDAEDNVWTANYLSSSVGLVAGGKVVSGTGFTGGGLLYPSAIATDGGGTVWVTNFSGNSLTELAGANASTPGAPISPATGWASDFGLFSPKSIAVDAAGNVWVACAGDDRLIEFVGAATPVKTPLLGGTRVP